MSHQRNIPCSVRPAPPAFREVARALVAVAAATFFAVVAGPVVAQTLHIGGTAVTATVFIADPDPGHYVESWTGPCQNIGQTGAADPAAADGQPMPCNLAAPPTDPVGNPVGVVILPVPEPPVVVPEPQADLPAFGGVSIVADQTLSARNAAGDIDAIYYGKRRGLHFVITRIGDPDSGPTADEASVVVHRDPSTSVVLSLTVPDPCENGCAPRQISTTPGWSLADYDAFCASGGMHKNQPWRVPTVGEAAALVLNADPAPLARKLLSDREIPGIIVSDPPQQIPLPPAGSQSETDSDPLPPGGAVAVYTGVPDNTPTHPTLRAAAFYANGNELAADAFLPQGLDQTFQIAVPETQTSITHKTFLRGAEGVAACVLADDPENYPPQPKLAVLQFTYENKTDPCPLQSAAPECDSFAPDQNGIFPSPYADETSARFTPDENGIVATLTLRAFRFAADDNGNPTLASVPDEADAARLRSTSPLVSLIKLSETDPDRATYAVSLAASVPAGTVRANLVAAPRVGRETRIAAAVVLQTPRDSSAALSDLPLQFAGQTFAAPDDRIPLRLSAETERPNAVLPDNWNGDLSDLYIPPQDVSVVYHGKRRGLHFAYVATPRDPENNLPVQRWRQMCNLGGNGGNGYQWRIPTANEAVALVENSDPPPDEQYLIHPLGWGIANSVAFILPPSVPGDADADPLADFAVMLPNSHPLNFFVSRGETYPDGIANYVFFRSDSANTYTGHSAGLADFNFSLAVPCVLPAANYRGAQNNANLHHSAPVFRNPAERPDPAADQTPELTARTFTFRRAAGATIAAGIALSLTVRAERRFAQIIPETNIPLSVGFRDPDNFFSARTRPVSPGEKIIVAQMTVAMAVANDHSRTLFIDAEVPNGQNRTGDSAMRIVVETQVLTPDGTDFRPPDYVRYPQTFRRGEPGGRIVHGRILADPEHAGPLFALLPVAPEIGITLNWPNPAVAPAGIALQSEYETFADEQRTTDLAGLVTPGGGYTYPPRGGPITRPGYVFDPEIQAVVQTMIVRNNQVNFIARDVLKTVPIPDGGRIIAMPNGFGQSESLSLTLFAQVPPKSAGDAGYGEFIVRVIPFRLPGIAAAVSLSQASEVGTTVAAFGPLRYRQQNPAQKVEVGSAVVTLHEPGPNIAVSVYADDDPTDPFAVMPNGQVVIVPAVRQPVPGIYRITARIVDGPDNWIAVARVLTLEIGLPPRPVAAPAQTRDLSPLRARPLGAGSGPEDMLPPETRRTKRVEIPTHRAVLAPDYIGKLFALSVALPRGYEMDATADAFNDLPNANLHSCANDENRFDEYGIAADGETFDAATAMPVHLRTTCPVRFRFTATTGLTLVASHPLWTGNDERGNPKARVTIDVYETYEPVRTVPAQANPNRLATVYATVYYERRRTPDAVATIPLEIIRLRPAPGTGATATTFYLPVESFNPAPRDGASGAADDFVRDYTRTTLPYKSLPHRTFNLRNGRPNINRIGNAPYENLAQFYADFMEYIGPPKPRKVFHIGGENIRAQVWSTLGEEIQYDITGESDGFRVASNGAVLVTTRLETDIANGRTYDLTIVATAPGLLGTLAVAELTVKTIPEFTICPEYHNDDNFGSKGSQPAEAVLPPSVRECPPVRAPDFTMQHDSVIDNVDDNGDDDNVARLDPAHREHLRTLKLYIQVGGHRNNEYGDNIVINDNGSGSGQDLIDFTSLGPTEIRRVDFRMTVFNQEQHFQNSPREPREFWRINFAIGGVSVIFNPEASDDEE